MKNKLTVSIVLATYNGETYLAQQIDSILKQTILPQEIIFVDDGSKDKTISIINSYLKLFEESSISTVLIEQKENVGYINNFLCGIEKATKDIIFLSDQDDIWLPQKIQIYTELFNTHLDMLALHGNTSLIDTSNHIIKENFQQYEKKLGKICLKDYLKKVNYPGMSLAFRNGDFKKKMLNTTEVIDRLPTHDWYICLLACIKNGFYITNQILTLRRYTGNNVALKMTNSKISNIENRIRGIDTYNKCYRLIENLQFKTKIRYIDIEPFINNNNIRIEYLRNYSLFKAIKNIKNIKYYPSIKSYVGDILLLIK